MFLVLSVACFPAGLVAFAYSSNQVMLLRGPHFQATDLISALRDLDYHDCLLCLQFLRSHRRVRLVRLRTHGL